MDNKQLWNQVKRPPETALKTIGGGRLKGMTDINPQWRLEIMTEIFGPCGKGWGYNIDKLWTEPGANGEVLCFALVNVWFQESTAKDSQFEITMNLIPGIGGHKLVMKESNGMQSNDEGYKMAVTDALSVALKALGVGADIYAGKWDGTKYKEEKEPEKPQKQPGDFDKALKAIQSAKSVQELIKYGEMINNRTWKDDQYNILKKEIDMKMQGVE